MSNTVFRVLLALAIPIMVLALGQAVIASGAGLPPSLSGLKVYGPYGALALTGVISLWFNRGRAFLALLCLAVAYIADRSLLSEGLDEPAARTAFASLCLFVPVNLALFSVLTERGLFTAFGLRRLLVIAAELAFTFWLIDSNITGFGEWISELAVDRSWLGTSTVPQRAMPVMLLALLLIAGRAFTMDSPVDAGMGGALVAFVVACHNVTHPSAFALFISCGAMLLLIGVLQDSYRMAFRDELTGLPSRRALNERLLGLEGRFTIAMLDVDNFKIFNDTHGHDVGDQVLKMVATEIEQVRRGGRGFRYGGEEFTLLFPRRGVRDVMDELERVRSQIEQHRLALRGADRPLEAKTGRSMRAGLMIGKTVSVTISIGVAESGDKLKTSDEVLKAADKALYRAKEKGRNCVSR